MSREVRELYKEQYKEEYIEKKRLKKKKIILNSAKVIAIISIFASINSLCGINLVRDMKNDMKSLKDMASDYKKKSQKSNDRKENNANEENTITNNVDAGQYENNRGFVTEFTDEEYAMFVSIIFCEAGAETYEAKLGVANVVLNRLYGDRYPNNLREVLYQKAQFSPAGNGLLDKRIEEYRVGAFTTNNHKECIQAANEAMEGHNNIGTQIGFLTPKLLEQYFGGQYKDKVVIGNIAFFNV